MTINAKYPGKCSKCNRSITVGEKIEWNRGSKAYHTSCPTKDITGRTLTPVRASAMSGETVYRNSARDFNDDW